MANQTIKKILVDQIGWVYSQFNDHTDAGSEPIEIFFVAGEMSHVAWYKKGKHEFNGKYVIEVVYD